MAIDFIARAGEQILAGEDLSPFEEAAMGDIKFRRNVEAYVEGSQGKTVKRMKKEKEETVLYEGWNHNNLRRRGRIYNEGENQILEIREYDDSPYGGAHIVIFKSKKESWSKEEFFEILKRYHWKK